MSKHTVVVVGAGFGGIALVKALKGSSADITIVDRRNYHLFQPLLYQAATSILAPSEVAWPIRQIFRERPDVETVLATVSSIDRAARRVHLADGTALPYDTLVLATGATHAYFGHDDWEHVAPGLKSVEDATKIRRHILLAFENAERSTEVSDQRAFLTFTIIGAGATGVELAGMIAELAHSALPREYRRIDTRSARILLVEAGSRVLSTFDPSLSAYAQRALEKQGVEIHLGQPVTGCTSEGVTIGSSFVPSRTIVWAAGVRASSAGNWLGASTDRAGRTVVGQDLSLPGDPNVFVVGDTALVPWKGDLIVPGIAPAAKQEGTYVARVLRARIHGRSAPGPFRYRHQGSLATIGRRAAVIDFGWIKLRGSLAWWIWGIAHIYFLIGARSRFAVAWSWLWSYLQAQPSAQLITDHRSDAP